MRTHDFSQQTQSSHLLFRVFRILPIFGELAGVVKPVHGLHDGVIFPFNGDLLSRSCRELVKQLLTAFGVKETTVAQLFEVGCVVVELNVLVIAVNDEMRIRALTVFIKFGVLLQKLSHGSLVVHTSQHAILHAFDVIQSLTAFDSLCEFLSELFRRSLQFCSQFTIRQETVWSGMGMTSLKRTPCVRMKKRGIHQSPMNFHVRGNFGVAVDDVVQFFFTFSTVDEPMRNIANHVIGEHVNAVSVSVCAYAV